MVHTTLFLGIYTLMLSTISLPTMGQLRWIENDFHSSFLNGYFGSSLVLNCDLSSPSARVMFGKLRADGTFASISIDGMKYERSGAQRLKINNLASSDAVPHACRADGIEDKEIDIFLKKKPKTSDFSITIMEEDHEKKKCTSRKADHRKIICIAVGSRKVSLYRESGRTRELIANVQNSSEDASGHIKQKLIYDIPDATKKDEGNYVCYLDTKLERKASKTHFLKVDDNPPVIKSFASKVVREGQSVTLKCKPNMMWPPEDITYFINGKPVTNPQFKSRYRANCQKLRIDRVKFPDDNGIVSCKVQNKYGYDMKNVTLFVKAKPEIDKSVSAILEKNVLIECKILHSNPVATIKWQVQHYCHTRIKECWPQEGLWGDVGNDLFKVYTTANYSRLSILQNGKGDYFFRCIARNSVGSDKHVVKYLSTREASNPLEIISKGLQVNEKETIHLTCMGNPRLFSTLSWFFNGRNISGNATTVSESGYQSSFTTKYVLEIKNATSKDTGNYTCVGKEIRGESISRTSIVTVKKIFAPTVHLTTQSFIMEGDAVILNCNVKSNPKSQISWYKDGIKINVEDTNFFGGEDQCPSSKNGYYFELNSDKKAEFARLIICDIRLPENNGTFICSATNALGNGSSTTAVNVMKKPSIELKATISVEVGDTVNEICKAIGNPKPKVFWRQKSSGKRMSTVNYSESNLTIPEVSEKQFTSYECMAWNALGNSTKTMKIQKKNFPILARTGAPRYEEKRTMLYVLLAVSFLTTLVFICVAFVLMRRKKIYGGFYLFSQPPDPDYLRNIDPSRALIEQSNGLPYDPVWEFPRKRIRLLDRLGSGAFGDVHLAEAVGIVCFEPREKASMRHRPLLGRKRSRSGSTSSRTGSSYRRLVTKVAVKKLKENATPEEMRDLVSELKILIHIGAHSNIVNLLGACTKGGDKELMVILEYAPHGNLLSFLKSRRQILKTTWKKDAVGMENELTTCDLAVIAYQVGKGMDFLASRRCVHRDLAARNVLVGEGYVMKIADFGLARDIYKDDRYVKLSAGLLPVKWMAIEAIKERIFTHQSDVWSYGILLWEIMTMGGSPYPGLPVRDLLEALVSGYRMDKPIYCPDEIYGLMSDCWIEEADDRPMFIEVVTRIARIIEAHLTPEESCNYLDQEHFTGDGYLRPIESPRSPNASLMSPPPPYSDYINQKENRFFGSETSLEEENSCKKIDYPDVVLLETKRLCSVSEIKAKRDAAQKEKKDSLSSSLPENEFEEESDSPEATPRFPLPNGRICFDKNSQKIKFYDCDKDIDEVELQSCVLLDEHSYVNHAGQTRENAYLNA